MSGWFVASAVGTFSGITRRRIILGRADCRWRSRICCESRPASLPEQHWWLESILRFFTQAVATTRLIMDIDEFQPNKSLQATRDGALSSATRFTLVGPACLSFFR